VGQAYFNLISARERTQAGRLAVEAAQVNLAQTTARYQRGVAGTTIVELIQAQVQFATANNNLINAIYDAHIARAQLSRAIGKQPAQ
jgi:outer membrane protein TolC